MQFLKIAILVSICSLINGCSNIGNNTPVEMAGEDTTVVDTVLQDTAIIFTREYVDQLNETVALLRDEKNKYRKRYIHYKRKYQATELDLDEYRIDIASTNKLYQKILQEEMLLVDSECDRKSRKFSIEILSMLQEDINVLK